jgi:hypothetical protein
MNYDKEYFKKSRRQFLIRQCDFPKKLIEWENTYDEKVKAGTEISDDKRIQKNAALLLCLCYIDGISPFLSEVPTSKTSKKTFIHALAKYSGNPCFGAIHPKILQDYLKSNRCKKRCHDILQKINPFLESRQSEKQFRTESEFITLLTAYVPLTDNELRIVKEHLFHGTYAAFAYKELRCRAVHELEPASFSFKSMIFNGSPIPKLDFDIFYEALQNIINNNIEKIVDREFLFLKI